jgi:hypothetical protein
MVNEALLSHSVQISRALRGNATCQLAGLSMVSELQIFQGAIAES